MQKAKEVFEIKKKSNFREKKQYSPIRRYKVDGEGLPIERKPKRAKFILIAVVMFIVLFLIMNYLFQVIAGGIRLFSTLPDKSEFLIIGKRWVDIHLRRRFISIQFQCSLLCYPCLSI